MLSVITPIDQTAWLGTASQDIAVEDLIRRSTSEFAAGTYNLVSNALVHGLGDGPPGLVSLQAQGLREGWIRLSVTDNGGGIAPESLDRVFDPFFTTRLGQGGSGLGLNIVYNIMTHTLGGTVRVQSVPGQGASFILELPCVGPEARAA
jgi:signal transduction histidine kinase